MMAANPIPFESVPALIEWPLFIIHEAASSSFQTVGCSTVPLDSRCQSLTLPESNLAGIQNDFCVFLFS